MSDIPTLPEIQETFALLDNWEDRYAYLIDLGRQLPPFPQALKTDETIVKGCTSRVWMVLTNQDGRVEILADSDAMIVRGLIALVIATYGGEAVDSLKDIDMEQIFSDLGLSDHLSPNRRNGFFAMVGKIQSFNIS
jgi:cysteine desulfuration protein SufE